MTLMSTGQVPGSPASGQFRIAPVNLEYASISPAAIIPAGRPA